MGYATARSGRGGRMLRALAAATGAAAIAAAPGSVLAAPAAAQPVTFIYNGSAVDWSEHTEIARLYRRTGEGIAICAATFLSDSWMLTAAHCVTDDGDAALHPGDNTLHPEAVPPGNLRVEAYSGPYDVDEVIVHPDFVEAVRVDGGVSGCTVQSCAEESGLQYAAHDVVVLHLQAPASGVRHVELLDDAGAVDSATPLTAYGWGDTDPGTPVELSQPLLATPPGVLYPVGERFPACNPAADQSIDAQRSILCVQARGGVSGAGAGDSGGPWFVSWDDGTTRQVAVTSFGSETGYPTHVPEQEAFVPPMSDWIVAVTGGAARASTPDAGAEAVPEPPGAGSPEPPGHGAPTGGSGSLASLGSGG